MGLLEESGFILKAGETVTKRGSFKGKMPKGMTSKVKLFSPKLRKKAEWEDAEGEMALTSSKLLAFAKKGRIKKEVVCYELDVVGVTTKKPRFGKEKLVLKLDLGTPRAETTELEVEDPLGWRDSITTFASQM